jgi:hypothetical protein
MEKWIEEELDLEDREIIADRDRLRECLIYFKWLAKNNRLSFEETGNLVDTFFENYPNLYQSHRMEISLLLKQKNFKEKSALHEMLYRFLEDENTNELKRMPFVNDIKEENKKYNIDTSLGRISLRKASDYFASTKSRYIFKKTLTGMCFDRTIEFIEQNPEYQAIVSYLPNVFIGGHYHAYAKKDDIIVDPACNAMFFDGTGELIEQGEIIYQATSEMLQKESDNYDYPKLLVAALKHKNKK